MTAAVLFGVVTPIIVLGYLLWRFEIVLGVCTVGVYLLEVAAQLISETLYVRKGLCSFIVVLIWIYTPPLCAGVLSLHWASSMSALHPSFSLRITRLTHCLCFGRRMLTRQRLWSAECSSQLEGISACIAYIKKLSPQQWLIQLHPLPMQPHVHFAMQPPVHCPSSSMVAHQADMDCM